MTADLGWAWRAFDAYVEDFRGGGGALAQLASDDVSVMATLPQPGRGVRTGRRALRELSDWRHRQLAMAGETAADGLTVGRNSQGRPVAAFEVRFTGMLGREPYKTHAAVVFELDGETGRLAAVREYYGDNTTPPSAFAPYGLEEIFLPSSGRPILPGKPATLARPQLQEEQLGAVETGQDAFDAFALSVRDGVWDQYLELMSSEVSFTLPIPGRTRGVQRGVDAVREYHRWRWEDLRMRAELAQQSLLHNGPTVAVEFDTLGVIGADLPVHHWAMYYFDVAGGRVVGFREYNGDEIQS